MHTLDILLFCVVGFTVVVFLILDSLEERKKSCHEAKQGRVFFDFEGEYTTGSSVEKSVEVSNDQEAEKEVVFENFKKVGTQEIEEVEENFIHEDSEKSDFSSGKTRVDDVEDNYEGEDELFEDWEGIERTELEKIFGKAVVYMSCKDNAAQISKDLNLLLYGLQKVVLEGPCYGSQPMALNVSARSNWNAWQKVGNMSREMAMEKYIDVLSKAIPKWKVEQTLIHHE
ncbi:hypothetical protein ACJIZ3_008008 [Penstemon smallii]|uniref:ACB domain-containing protein n=1 Tax=Penstemon smallii TaxID=265156 RepID=A0ABD3TA98_9LAMI